jgi:hypothetical protein
MLTQKDYSIITDSLANLMDWDSENLEKDFVSLIATEIPNLPQDKVIKMFEQFICLHPIQRDALDFDFQAFIQNSLA